MCVCVFVCLCVCVFIIYICFALFTRGSSSSSGTFWNFAWLLFGLLSNRPSNYQYFSFNQNELIIDTFKAKFRFCFIGALNSL